MKRGTIEPHKMFKLYKGLYDQRASGWLHLNHRSGARKIYIDRGYPAFALSAVANEKLFPRLIREGICSSSETATLEQKAVESDALIEEVLLRESVISEARLRQVYVDITSESVWRSLSWRDGEFGWIAGEDQMAYMTPVEVITLLGIAGQVVLSEPEVLGVLRQVSEQALLLSKLDPASRGAISELIGEERARQLTHGAQLSALGLDPLNTQDTSVIQIRDAICGLLLSGFFTLTEVNASSTSQRAGVESSSTAPIAASTALPPMTPPPMTPPSARSNSVSPPGAVASPQSLPKPSRVHTPRAPVAPPPSFVDDRAMVKPKSPSKTTGSYSVVSEKQASSSSTVSSSVDRGAQKDRRIIKPPENWRQFSIGKRNTPAPAPPAPAPPAPAPPAPAPPAPAPPAPAPPAPAPPAPAPPAPAPPAPAPPAPAPLAPAPPAPAPPAPAPPAVGRGVTQQTTTKQKKQAPVKIQAKVERFLDVYERRASLNHYELLNVESNVDQDALKKVFKKLVAELHIDRFLRFDFSEDILESLKQLFIEYNKAYQVLSHPDQRQEYDLEIQQTHSSGSDAHGGGAANQKRDLAQLLQAEQLTKEAVNFVKSGKLDLAEEKVEVSLSINADDPLTESVKIYIDGVKAKSKGASVAVLRQYIDRLEALTITYETREEPYLYLSVLYGYCEEYKRGIKAAERALEINPHFGEASSQLRHLQRLDPQSKTEKTARKSGLFRRR